MFVFSHDFVNGLSVLIPNLFSNEGRVSKDKIKEVMILFRYVFRMIEVIFIEIRIFLAEFFIKLHENGGTSKRYIGFSWFGFSIA